VNAPLPAPLAPDPAYAPIFIGADPDAAALDPAVVGSKAAMLARMAQLGLRVPPAFVLPTRLCEPLNQRRPGAEQALAEGLRQGVRRLEGLMDRKLGDSRRPLLVSVRSGAAHSMPGMLSTVLDVGLNADTVRGLLRVTGNPRMAWDSFRRFVGSYAEVAGGAPPGVFAAQMAEMIREEQAGGEEDLDPEALERLTKAMLAAAEAHIGRPVPDDPMDQLLAAARAVYRSWNSDRAAEYRRLNHLDGDAGTAVTVQAMVFGNSGARSGACVAFTRDPATGEPGLYLDFLSDAQGEDVVSGRRTPGDAQRLARRLPEVAVELSAGAVRLERALGDMQDIEFTVEEGRLYFLQTRPAKRTPRAVLRTAVDLVREGLITPAEGLARVAGVDIARAGVARFVGDSPAAATAIPASCGVAAGLAAFDAETAVRLAAQGQPVILVRPEISTDDLAGFAAADGILTAVGGRTAHAAVVARQLGKVCLVGCAGLIIDRRAARLGEASVREGDWLSLDGESGEVFLGRRQIAIERPEADLAEIDRWRAALAPQTDAVSS
jgi:pyruvate,orthophosphate dikinase